jgi:hypothetical protein
MRYGNYFGSVGFNLVCAGNFTATRPRITNRYYNLIHVPNYSSHRPIFHAPVQKASN